MLRTRLAAALSGAALLLAACAAAPIDDTAAPATQDRIILSTASAAQAPAPRMLARYMNAYRAERGRTALRQDARLQAAALAHARDMATKGYFAHRGKDGRSPHARIRAAGYRGCSTGENLAMGYRTPEGAMKAWMKSPSHNRALLHRPYRDYGLARVGSYWVLTLGGPCGR